MDLGLENKRVLVTGSTGGIGGGIAKHFAQEGATVLINGRRTGEAERVAAEIRERGGQALVAAGDLTKDGDVATIVEFAQDVFNKMMGSEAPFPRMGSIDEVANVVVFLASPLASYVHGANIRVDGGWVPTVN
jgi:NAD(P)-dependent dehydrogenase (short-subunit alcohol dehydrogenase family)